ncbi:BrnA antitoxin family protein [Methylobacterium sp. Leaf466]|uniref:BrnA antitoxin family protein n=1 Tax=Methylobacterium sp. Leaf466 TaxID=1736386 RepID=UPI0006FB11A5|nr:BrnA antitoxin family protein [Methylobacterium sp. Leaf466]KQT77824.1 hypothetical protein ASG59_10850 [Methylobacterium sp. Leaf466]
MARKPAPNDDDVPALTDGELAQMRPASEVLTREEFVAVTAIRKAARGRPPVASPKVPVTIRLDADTVAAFKATGTGWQTRMNEVLRAGKPAGTDDHVASRETGSPSRT